MAAPSRISAAFLGDKRQDGKIPPFRAATSRARPYNKGLFCLLHFPKAPAL
jgi:hypothetical protein